MKYDVTINATVDIPQSEVDAIEDDEDADIEQYLEEHLDLSFTFGHAWVCAVDQAQKIGA
jgi:hypothetical protein